MIFRTKPLVVSVIAVIVLALIIFAATRKPVTNEPASPVSSTEDSPLAAPPEAPTAAGTPTPPAPTPVPGAKPAPAPVPKPQPVSVSVVSPNASIRWIFGVNNVIQWSKEVGFKGEIYLMNAADNSIAGWILQETGIRQTSYTWNTRDVYVSATNPSKTTVAKGDYIVVLKFHTNPVTEARSPRFSVIYENEAQIPSYTLTIQNYAFSPTSLVVKRGDKVVFTNTDSVTHEITLQTFPKIVLAPGASVTFDTSPLGTGPHNFYSETYSTLKITVTVQ